MIAQHILDTQLLDGNDAEAVDDALGVLVTEVIAAVADALVDTSNDLADLSALAAPALLLGEFPLPLR